MFRWELTWRCHSGQGEGISTFARGDSADVLRPASLALLGLASVLGGWAIWRQLWPLEILSMAMGFLFAAIYMRVIWLIIPAIIIGLNGMAFQFCATTGLWRWWSVLWVVEPLSAGLLRPVLHPSLASE